MIFNAAAARHFGVSPASELLGQTVTFSGSGGETRTVVGIMDDFEVSGIAEVYTNTGRLGREEPIMLYWSPQSATHALVRSQSGNLAALRDQLETTWTTRIETVQPFSAQFYSDITRMRYGPLQDAAVLTSSVAGLAILIAILGLLSLAAHHVRTRRKEIGVRKALGARVRDVTYELSKGFAGIVAAAAVLAIPLAWLLNSWWLQFFSDRIGLSLLVIGLCAIGLVALSVGVIVSQTVRAARLRPTLCLRDE
jgi:putative ABC transport system permease protein